MVVALLALFVAMGGTGMAASKLLSGSKIKKNSLPGDRIKKGSVKGDRLKRHTITATQLNLAALGTIPNATNAVNATNAQNAANAAKAANADHATSADTAAALNGLKVFPVTRVAATDGPNAAAARSGAPEQKLFEKGVFTIYAKCFHDTGADATYAEVYIRTSQNGAIFYSDDDSAYGSGGTFLNTDTTETNRWLSDGDSPASANSASAEDADYTPFWAIGTDGTSLQGAWWAAEKDGTLAGPTQGPYGDGSACLFMGRVFG